MKITNIEGERGVAEADGGVRTEILLSLLDNPKVGEYVLIHTGVAIEKISDEEAKKTIALINEMYSHANT